MTKEQLKEKNRKYYQENKERWKKYKKPLVTKEEKERRKQLRRDYKENNPEITLWSNVKYRAKKNKIDFNIEVSDIIIPEFCPYLGLKLVSKKGKGHLDNLMSVDRINPKLGYIKGNVEVISYKANRMKNNATIEELMTFSKNTLKKYENYIS